MIGRLRRQAIERGELVEDVSWHSGHRFILRVPGFDQLKKGIIWKPLGYVRNGWHRAVTPAIPKRVLNLFLQQPRQRVYRLETRYIAAKCRRRYPGDRERSVASLNAADVGKALRMLVRLGLLAPQEDGFRINWECFNRLPPTDGPSFDAPDPRERPLFRQAAAIDAQLAERTLELLDLGNYDPDTHLAAMLRDLAHVRDDDYALLSAKVYRHRNRPPGPDRWRNTWKAFQYELKRRVAEFRAPKHVIMLGETPSIKRTLALDLDQVQGRILAVRMVSRVEWPWYFLAKSAAHLSDNKIVNGPETVAVELALKAGDSVLFTRSVQPGDAEVRYSFHPNQWADPKATITLSVRCARPLPGVRVEAWLETRLRR